MTGPSSRPFVPTSGQGSDLPRTAKFEIQPPFVPGRIVAHDASQSSGAEPSVAAMDSYPPIEDFLAAGDGEADGAGAESYDDAAYPPPIEHFMDSGDDEAGETSATTQDFFSPPASGQEAGWGQTDWQGYDWRSAGALGEGAEQARDDWAATDWQGAPAPARDTRQSAAQAIAAALDQIAERIRSGELSVPSAELVTDQATIAATLAALLGVRR